MTTLSTELATLARRVAELESDRDCLRVERDGAGTRAKMVLESHHKWADRARVAEATVARLTARFSDDETATLQREVGDGATIRASFDRAIARRLQAEPVKLKRPCSDCGKEEADECFTVCSPCWDAHVAKKNAEAEPVAPQGAVKVEPPDVAPPEVVSEPNTPSITHMEAVAAVERYKRAEAKLVEVERERDKAVGEQLAHICPETATANEIVKACAHRCMGLGTISGWVNVGEKAGAACLELLGRFAVVAAPVEPETLTDEQAQRMYDAYDAQIRDDHGGHRTDAGTLFRAMRAAWGARPVVEQVKP